MRKLEGDGGGCEESGIAPGERVRFEIGEPLQRGEVLPPPECCAACGKMTRMVISLELGDAELPWLEGEDRRDGSDL